MSNPLAILNDFEPAKLMKNETGSVTALRTVPAFAGADVAIATPEVLALSAAKFYSSTKDYKLSDYLFLGVLSIAIHFTLVDHFKGLAFEQTLPEPVKQPPKVQITLARPQPPKPVPPPPQVQPKPPVQKAVPLKPPKIKPLPKVVEETPVVQTPVTNAPTTPAPAPAAPPPPVVEEKIVPPTAGADYLHNPEPEYPELAQERGWEGKVFMKVHVQADGKPDEVIVAKSSGQKVLDDAAVKTVYKWSFVPAKRGDTPVAGYVTVPIVFHL